MVVKRAKGCCEYCRIPEEASFAPHEIDHVIAEKHGGPTASENLAFSCLLCNKCKGSDIASIDPETGETVRLYNPRLEPWSDHFEVQLDGRVAAKTGVGRATVRLLRFNDADRVAERRLLIDAGVVREGAG